MRATVGSVHGADGHDRRPGGDAARDRGRRHHAGRRRRHLHSHPAAAERRPAARSSRPAPTRPPTSSRSEAAGLAWLADGRRRAVPEVLAVERRLPDPRVGRAGPRRAPTAPRASAARWQRPTRPVRSSSAATARRLHRHRCRCRTARADRLARSSAPPGGCCPYLKLARDRDAHRRRRRRGDRGRGATASPSSPGRDEPPEPAARRPVVGQRDLGTRRRRLHLIDPAAHGGHRETDLAMLALFGCPHLARVLEAYDEARAARRRLARPGRRCTSSTRCSCTRAIVRRGVRRPGRGGRPRVAGRTPATGRA